MPILRHRAARMPLKHKDSNLPMEPSRDASDVPPSPFMTFCNAALYVLSGCSQPLLMTLLKSAGLANPSAQIYMVFYYVAPASLIFYVLHKGTIWPTSQKIFQACGIAIWDICSTSLNYTGASLAGPTIFAIIYSSVTIWTALFSTCFLQRYLNLSQWIGVAAVFGGLAVTATSSSTLGPDVSSGVLLVTVGSAMHAMTYVMSESIMTRGEQRLDIWQNCAVQGLVACGCFLVWELVYALPRWDMLVGDPMAEAETSWLYATFLLLSFAFANLIHSITFYYVLRHAIQGATAAGVMKGLQAVLVFLFTHFVYCGRMGGAEMCFTLAKFASLVTVVGGVTLFSTASQDSAQANQRKTGGYQPVNEAAIEMEES